MNILYVCGHDPRERSFGGPQRTNLLWESLKEIGEVYSICLYPNAGILDDRIVAVKAVKPKGIKLFVNKIVNKIWEIFDKDGKKLLPFASLFSIENPYPGVKFDIVVCRYCEPAALFHLWEFAPLYIDIDDHPIEAFSTRDKLLLKKWQRPFAHCLQQLEFHVLLKKMAGGWIANPEQVKLFNRSQQVISLRNLPNSPASRYNPNADRGTYVFSIGFMEYQPNYLGVEAFLHDIWPKVHEAYPELRYLIGGKNAPIEYQKRWNAIPGVSYLGYVDNLDSLYESALATVVPVEQGSGTCIKTLESLAYSRVCLCKPFGCRGIEKEASNGNGLLVYETKEDFLEQLNFVLDDKKRYVAEQNAAAFTRRNYSIGAFKASVKELIGRNR